MFVGLFIKRCALGCHGIVDQHIHPPGGPSGLAYEILNVFKPADIGDDGLGLHAPATSRHQCSLIL
jgi:hypothetical protein